MKPQPQPGAGRIGGATPNHGDALTCELAGKWPLTSDLPALFSPDAAMAMLAFNANQALTCQVSVAHVFAHLAEEQSRTLAQASADVLPEGPVRDAMQQTAALQARFAKELASAASRFGRSFGHMAFAFPPADHGCH
jgi:hypothetical protein